jgi:ribosomal protein L14E/L6E/L27E
MELMFDCTGCFVQATAGRDRGGVFLVVGVQLEQGFLLLADGKRRKFAHPKRKKPGHVVPLEQTEFDHPVIRKLQEGQQVSDKELRRALAAFKGGNHAWQKTI